MSSQRATKEIRLLLTPENRVYLDPTSVYPDDLASFNGYVHGTLLNEANGPHFHAFSCAVGWRGGTSRYHGIRLVRNVDTETIEGVLRENPLPRLVFRMEPAPSV